MKRIGVDVGGTFTDLVIADENGDIRVHKTPSTPSDPSEAILTGTAELCAMAEARPKEIDQFFHGTTVATNIILEHNGAKVGLITTRGFRDILHIARHKRPLNFSHQQDLPWQSHPIVARRHRIGVTERVLPPNGEVLVPLDEAEVRDAARRLKAEGVEAVAVCFLYSFLNLEHERRVVEILREEFPEAFLSVRHELLSQFREYEGFSTVALNAYVGPKVSRYVRTLESALRGMDLGCGLHLMASNGGVMTATGAVERPVQTLFSGPTAGLVGGMWIGRLAGHPNVITFDVGGTSADIAVASDGEFRMRHLLDTRVGEYDAMIPMLDIDTIGAGGGSIATVDPGGALTVGPRSAGSSPGPACYGRGGTLPTVTDAMLVLGRIRPDQFLGGNMTLHPEPAHTAILEHVANPLGMPLHEAADAVRRIVVHNMAEAIRVNSVRKGYDPREFALVAFGGAGPLFGCEIARELSIPTVISPPFPGITSAMGLLVADLRYEFVSTTMMRTDDADLVRLRGDFARLEEQARDQLRTDRIPDTEVRMVREIDCRYVGQGYELRVTVPLGSIDGAWIEEVREAFHTAHKRQYLHDCRDVEIEMVNIRVVGIGEVPDIKLPPVEAGDGDPARALKHVSDVFFMVDGAVRPVETAYYDRSLLRSGDEFTGPAIVEQTDTTTVIPPGLAVRVDDYGNLLIDCTSAADDIRVPATRPSETGLDPVTLQVLGGSFKAIGKEMALSFMRTAYSSIIRESEDLGAGLFDAEGNELCESDTTPMQIGPLSASLRGILRKWRGRLHEGDVIIHNHPYHGATHSLDILIAVPIFWEGEHIAFSVCSAHYTDVGGANPGINPDVVDMWAEAKIYDAVRIVHKGVLNEDLWQHILDNVRSPTANKGDLEAGISACHQGKNRFLGLARRFGADVVMSAARWWIDYSERLLREEISKLPDGDYVAPEAWLDDDGRNHDVRLPIAVKVTVRGDTLVVDLTGSAPEVDTGTNVPFEGSTKVAVYFATRATLLDEAVHTGFIPQNEGMFKPIEVVCPKGLIYNPNFPKASTSRFPQSNRLVDSIVLALAPVLGERAMAGSSGECHSVSYGFYDKHKNEYDIYLEVNEGSYGARVGRDGMDSVDALLPNTRNNPIEELEWRFPIRCERYELRAEPAAAGKWRGGIGVVRELRFLDSVIVSCEGDRQHDVPKGILGGHNGLPAALLRNPGTEREERWPSRFAGRRLEAGDLWRIVTPSAAGLGDPLERDPERVLRDVIDGFATIETARTHYHVVIDPATLTLDHAATAALRDG